MISLPNVLRTQNGEIVRNKKEWNNIRRKEILQLFKKNVYGEIPPKPEAIFFREINRFTCLNDKAICTEVDLYFSEEYDDIKQRLLIIYPKKKTNNIPAFVGLNFTGNHTILDNSNITINAKLEIDVDDFNLERGSAKNRWPVEKIIDNGYGLITCNYQDIIPDNHKVFKKTILRFEKIYSDTKLKIENLGAVSIWAWYLMRIADYIELSDIFNEQICVIGHSRLGKTALWAGANDERFKIVIANASGSTGASISRLDKKETVKDINTSFPHWFCSKYKEYSENEKKLPIDQHMLLALIAPRPLYIGNALSDEYSDSDSEYRSLVEAGKVYKIFEKDYIDNKNKPEIMKPVLNKQTGYHIRSGNHDITKYDWENYIKFTNIFFK